VTGSFRAKGLPNWSSRPKARHWHWPKIHSTNGREWLDSEVKRRTEVVGIFLNEDRITRLVGAILLEQNDGWAAQRPFT
jgi:transposase-like protein